MKVRSTKMLLQFFVLVIPSMALLSSFQNCSGFSELSSPSETPTSEMSSGNESSSNLISRNFSEIEMTESIIQIYVAAVQRPPELSGFNYWLKEAQSRKSSHEIASIIFSLDGVKAIYPATMSSSDFVTAIYHNVFSRDPDDEGLNYWVKSLESGRDRGRLALEMVMAGLHTADGTPGKSIIVNRMDFSRYALEQQQSRGNDVSPDNLKAVFAMVNENRLSVEQAKSSLASFLNLPATNGEIIVASIYSDEDSSTNVKTCQTIHSNPSIKNVGYFDDADYSSCSSNGNPECINGSTAIRIAETPVNSTKTKHQTVCVKDDPSQGFRIVATIYSKQTSSGNECLTSENSNALKVGYFDKGGYSQCTSEGIPMCLKGAKKVVLSNSLQIIGDSVVPISQGGSIKYFTGCIINDYIKSKIVANISSQTIYVNGKATDSCSVTYDSGSYATCDNNIPLCKNGAYKVVTNQTASGNTYYYKTACMIDSKEYQKASFLR